jgi:hypothetical protein
MSATLRTASIAVGMISALHGAELTAGSLVSGESWRCIPTIIVSKMIFS